MAKEIAYQTILKSLQDETKPFPPGYLHRFSDLVPAQIKAMLKLWPGLSLARKQAFLGDLEELAEADTLVNFDDLARSLLYDPDAPLRTLAVRLLWQCKDPDLAPVFMDLLANDRDGGVRAAAATALGLFIYLGEVDDISPELWHQVEELLIHTAMQASEKLIQRRALEALGFSSREEVPGMIEAAYARKDPDWKVSAIFAMGKSADNRWSKQVLSNLHADNDEVRSEAIRAAGELGLGSARKILIDLLDDMDDKVDRREVIWALSQIGGQGVREQLDELLEEEGDDEEAEFLEEALENLTFTEGMALTDLFDIDGELPENDSEDGEE
jgi:HEAT repeat protein